MPQQPQLPFLCHILLIYLCFFSMICFSFFFLLSLLCPDVKRNADSKLELMTDSTIINHNETLCICVFVCTVYIRYCSQSPVKAEGKIAYKTENILSQEVENIGAHCHKTMVFMFMYGNGQR